MNHKFLTTLAAAALAGAAALASAQTIKIDKAALQPKGGKDGLTEKDGVVTAKGGIYYVSKQSFAVDPAKTYVISGEFRRVSGKSAPLFFGFVNYDAKGVEFFNPHSAAIKGADTQLVEAVAKGAVTLKVKDASKWKISPYTYVACNTKPDYSDLPNRNIVGHGVVSTKKEANYWLVTLKAPFGVALPAGANLRAHSAGGYAYPAAGGTNLPNQWKKFSGTFKGLISGPGFPYNAFAKGTKTFKVLIITNYGNKDSVTEFKNVTLTIK